MKYRILNHKKVLSILPKRAINAHKGNMGKILLLCGSKGFTGAAAMAAMGALRVGAGLVYLGVPECIYGIESVKLNEPIVLPLHDNEGMLSVECMDEVARLLPKMDTVLLGPGLGVCDDTEKIVKFVLETFQGPVILDADGITVMVRHKNVLRGRTGQTIITPHEGEFARFTGSPVDNRINCAQALAQDLGCIVVLKGHETVITDGFTGYLNKTGNPGMAVGGSGDVLAGIITALVGQGIAPLEAASCGVWLHGAAGDICAREIGVYGMLPSDMIQVLPRLMK